MPQRLTLHDIIRKLYPLTLDILTPTKLNCMYVIFSMKLCIFEARQNLDMQQVQALVLKPGTAGV